MGLKNWVSALCSTAFNRNIGTSSLMKKGQWMEWGTVGYIIFRQTHGMTLQAQDFAPDAQHGDRGPPDPTTDTMASGKWVCSKRTWNLMVCECLWYDVSPWANPSRSQQIGGIMWIWMIQLVQIQWAISEPLPVGNPTRQCKNQPSEIWPQYSSRSL